MRAISLVTVDQAISHFPDEIAGQITKVKSRLQAMLDTPLVEEKEIQYLTLLIEKIAEIITAKPGRLAVLKNEFDEIISGQTMADDLYEDFRTEINRQLWYVHWREIFYPKYFAKLGIKVCVYCNAQSALVIEREESGDQQAKFQVDHYLPKKEYPCFSIALFNLYPVCASCNNIKSTKKILFELYVDSPTTSTYNFYLEKDKGEYLSSRDIEDIKICVDGPVLPDGSDYSDFVKLFGLKGIYNHYRDIAEELILKAEIYTPGYRASLLHSFAEYMQPENINRLITGNYTEEDSIHKRPLSKFVRDISIDVGLIEKDIRNK